MVHTKGSRFGVFSGHTVRRPEFSYSQLCADQHILIQSNKSFKRGTQVSNDVHLSMNKKNRWQMTDNMVDELSDTDCTVIVSRHHLKPGQYRKVADCLQVCSQKKGERHFKSANRTYARTEDLSEVTGDTILEDDVKMNEMPTRRRKGRKGRKGYKKRQNQEEVVLEEEMLIHCKVYTAPPKHRFQIQPPRGSYSGKSSKTRKGLPGGNITYYQETYEDEIWYEEEDFSLKEAMENSLDAMRSTGWEYTAVDNSLEDFILSPVRDTQINRGKKNNSTKKGARDVSCEEAKDQIFYVDREEYAVPSSWQSESYIPKSRGWKKEKIGKKRNLGKKMAEQSIKVSSTLGGDQPSFLVNVRSDIIKDLKIAASKCFDCSSFRWGKCLPPRLVIDVTPYVHGKLREGSFVNTIRAMTQLKKECWILVERNGKGAAHDTTIPHGTAVPQHSTDEGIQTIRFTLVGFPRDDEIERETRDNLNHRHLSRVDRVMDIFKEHVDKLPLERFFIPTSFPSGKPEIKLDVLSKVWVWNSKKETVTSLQLMNQLDSVEDSCHGNTFLEETFLQPLGDFVADCSICLESDITGPDGITMYATALTDCQHWFCDNCWRSYLETAISCGETKLTCPAFDCKSTVDEVTLVSFVPHSTYQQHKEHQFEALRVSQRLDPCPKEGCGHLLPRIPEGSIKSTAGVLCACGGVWCNSCRDKLHWPSTCEQNEKYKEKYNNGVGILKVGKIKHVNVKRCPACSSPMEKSGGCMHVVCRCSHAFCWACGQTWQNHNYNCREEKTIVTMQVELIDVVILKSNYDRAVFHRSRGRRSAIKTRQEQANNLFSKLLSATLSHRVKGTYTSDLPSTGSVGTLSQVFKDTLRFCCEVEFVLEHLEIYLTSRSILNTSKRQLVREIKDRLAYLSNQIHQILEQKTSFDIFTVSKRLENLSTSGKENLHRLAVTLK